MTKRKTGGNPEIELPITPMLDMAFQLLIFFIFAYQPSALEGQVDMSMPTGVAGTRPEDGPPVETPPRAPVENSSLKIRLHTHHDGINNGALAFPVIVEGLAERSNHHSIKELAAFLQRSEAARVELVCDSGLKWDGVVAVMDACRTARIKNVGLGSDN
jgi:biopolymer transport protein ExbD